MDERERKSESEKKNQREKVKNVKRQKHMAL
jgi:hypothetical protein